MSLNFLQIQNIFNIREQGGKRSSQMLELAHSDVHGSLRTPSLGGSPYFISIVDDYSRYAGVYVTKAKSETLDRFEQSHMMAQRHTGKILKKVRGANGGEYTLTVCKQYLAVNGI